jgi:membrane protein DedA with SNARE-associated domain
MEEYIYHLMRTGTIYIVFGIIFISSMIEYVFPPFPGDSVILLGSLMAGRGELPVYPIFFLATMGSFVGSIAIYAFGATKGRKYFLKRNFAFFSATKVRSLESFFRRRGGAVIALNRFAPGFRSFFFVAAGIAKMPFIRVSLYSLISIILWNTGLTYIGFRVGGRWEELKELLELYSTVAVIFISGVFVLSIIYQVILNRIDKKREDKNGI